MRLLFLLLVFILLVPGISSFQAPMTNGLYSENIGHQAAQNTTRYIQIMGNQTIYNLTLDIYAVANVSRFMNFWSFDGDLTDSSINTSMKGNLKESGTITYSASEYGRKACFDGSSGSANTTMQYHYGAGDFDIIFRPTNINGTVQRILGLLNDAQSNYMVFDVWTNSSMRIVYIDDVGTYYYYPFVMANNTDYHFSILWNETDYNFLLNGTSLFKHRITTDNVFKEVQRISFGSDSGYGSNANVCIDQAIFFPQSFKYNSSRKYYPYPLGFGFAFGNRTNYKVYESWNYSTSNKIIINASEIDVYKACLCPDCVGVSGGCNIPVFFQTNEYGYYGWKNLTMTYKYSLFLIDEKTSTGLNLNNITKARAYYDDNSTLFDFKLANTSEMINASFFGDKIRIYLEYADGSVVNRWIDTNLIESSEIRICANPEGTTHYQQIITSSSQRPVLLRSTYANCYVAADYTRFGYQDFYILQAWTIPFQYALTVTDTDGTDIVSSIDGSLQSEINIDSLIFSQTAYDLDILQDALTFEKYNENTTKIYYENLKGDLTAASLNIKRVDTMSSVFLYSGFTDPNKWTIYYSWGNVTGLNSTSMFLLELTTTSPSGTETVKRYFNGNASQGILSAQFALVLSILCTIFGLTFTMARYTFGWFGIFVQLGSLLILSLTPMTWYILFMQAINVIILIFIVIKLTVQNSPTVS